MSIKQRVKQLETTQDAKVGAVVLTIVRRNESDNVWRHSTTNEVLVKDDNGEFFYEDGRPLYDEERRNIKRITLKITVKGR